MDLRQIRYFTAISKAGSLSKAAEKLRIAQPALSRQMQALELELGAKLFDRTTRGIRLTEAGGRFLERSGEISRLVTEAFSEAKGESVQVIGPVSLGAPPALGLIFVPELVARTQSVGTSMKLYIREGSSSSLQDWLFSRSIDVALMHSPPSLEGLDTEHLLQDPMILIASPNSKIGKEKRSLSSRDVARLPLLVPSLPHTHRRILEDFARQNGFDLNIFLEIDSLFLIKAMVSIDIGCSIVPYSTAKSEIEAGSIIGIKIKRPAIVSNIMAVWLREKSNTQGVILIRNVLRQIANDLDTKVRQVG